MPSAPEGGLEVPHSRLECGELAARTSSIPPLGVATFGLSVAARQLLPWTADLKPDHLTPGVAYVSLGYSIILGFVIVFLFGYYSDARSAVGAEATAIGTAFNQAHLFPESEPDIQHALICYARSLPLFEWPALRADEDPPEVDEAYADIFERLGDARESTTGTFQPAVATNLAMQLGNISSARETRTVAARVDVTPLLWTILLGGGLLVTILLFFVTAGAGTIGQASMVAVASTFTASLLVLVLALSTPFGGQLGVVAPTLIEAVTLDMESEAPTAAARPCHWEARG